MSFELKNPLLLSDDLYLQFFHSLRGLYCCSCCWQDAQTMASERFTVVKVWKLLSSFPVRCSFHPCILFCSVMLTRHTFIFLKVSLTSLPNLPPQPSPELHWSLMLPALQNARPLASSLERVTSSGSTLLTTVRESGSKLLPTFFFLFYSVL